VLVIYPPQFIYETQPKSPGEGFGYGVAIDKYGFIYTVGAQESAYADLDIMIIKFEPNSGNLIWMNLYDGPASFDDIGTDIIISYDYILVTGYVHNGNDYDIWLGKFSLDGDLIWETIYDGGDDDYGLSLIVDVSGDIYVVGSEFIQTDEDIWVARFDHSSGDLIWITTYDGGYGDDYANCVAADRSRFVYVTGVRYNGLNDDIWLGKFTPEGELIWSTSYDKGYDDYASGVVTFQSAVVYVTGSIFNGFDDDIWIGKFDAFSGSLMWESIHATTYDDSGWDVIVDGLGYPYITGYANDDLLFAKFNPKNGALLWDMIYGTITYSETGTALAMNLEGFIYITGIVDNGVDYNLLLLKYSTDYGSYLQQLK
jgi:hypothetical protein